MSGENKIVSRPAQWYFRDFRIRFLKKLDVFKLLSMAYMDSLLPVDKERYLNKLNSVGLDSCTYIIKDRVDDPTQWPAVAQHLPH